MVVSIRKIREICRWRVMFWPKYYASWWYNFFWWVIANSKLIYFKWIVLWRYTCAIICKEKFVLRSILGDFSSTIGYQTWFLEYVKKPVPGSGRKNIYMLYRGFDTESIYIRMSFVWRIMMRKTMKLVRRSCGIVQSFFSLRCHYNSNMMKK